MSIKHAYTNAVPDGTHTSVVRPRDWNSAHIHEMSLSGNTVGQSAFTANDIVFQGGPNVTLSGTANAGQATLAISVAAPPTTYEFANSNGIMFGTSGSQVTASYTVPEVLPQSRQPVAYAAGGHTNTVDTLAFINSNGVSFVTQGGGIAASVQTNYAAPDITTNAIPSSLSSRFQHTSATSAITSGAFPSANTTKFLEASNSSLFQHTSGTAAITAGAFPLASSTRLQFLSNTSNITAGAIPIEGSSSITSAALHTSLSSLFQHTSATVAAIPLASSTRLQFLSNTSDITSNAIPLAGSSSITSAALNKSASTAFVATSNSSLFQHVSDNVAAIPLASSTAIQFKSATSAITTNLMPLASSTGLQFLSNTSAITSNAINTSVSSLFTGGGGTNYIPMSSSSFFLATSDYVGGGGGIPVANSTLFQHTSATSAITLDAINTSLSSLFTGGGGGASDHNHGGFYMSLTNISASATTESNGFSLQLSAAAPYTTPPKLWVGANNVNGYETGSISFRDSNRIYWGIDGNSIMTASYSHYPLLGSNGMTFGTRSDGYVTASFDYSAGATAPIDIRLAGASTSVSYSQRYIAFNNDPSSEVHFEVQQGTDLTNRTIVGFINPSIKIHMDGPLGQSSTVRLSEYFLGPNHPALFYKSDHNSNWSIKWTTASINENGIRSVIAPYMDMPGPLVQINGQPSIYEPQYGIRSLSIVPGAGMAVTTSYRYLFDGLSTTDDYNGKLTVGLVVDTAYLAGKYMNTGTRFNIALTNISKTESYATSNSGYTLSLSVPNGAAPAIQFNNQVIATDGTLRFLDSHGVYFGMNSSVVTAYVSTFQNVAISGNTLGGGYSSALVMPGNSLTVLAGGQLQAGLWTGVADNRLALSVPFPQYNLVNMAMTTAQNNGQYSITLSANGGTGGGGGAVDEFQYWDSAMGSTGYLINGIKNQGYADRLAQMRDGWSVCAPFTFLQDTNTGLIYEAQAGINFRVAANTAGLTTVRNLSETVFSNRPILVPMDAEDFRRNYYYGDTAITGRIMVSGAASSNRSLGGTVHLGVYHRNTDLTGAPKLMLAASASQSFSITASSQSTLWNGPMYMDFELPAENVAMYDDAAVVLLFRPVSANATWFNLPIYGAPNPPNIGRILRSNAFNTLATNDFIGWRQGVFSTTTAGLPDTIHYSQFRANGSASVVYPMVELFDSAVHGDVF